MSRPLGGRRHLWFWVTAGVLLYVASCAPVEAWHEKHFARNHRHLPLRVPPSQPQEQRAGPEGHPAAHDLDSIPHASAARSTVEGEFEIVELKYQEPPEKPRWMRYLYAPVHLMESYPPFAGLFVHYRRWCEGMF